MGIYREFAACSGATALALVAFPGWAQTGGLMTGKAAEPTTQSADGPASGSPEGASQDADSGDDITVTASRIKRNGFNEPTPVTVIGAEDLARRGVTNVAEAFLELPAFRGSVSQTPSQNIGFLAFGQNAVDLRGLGSVRTLVLVDGRRFVTTPLINSVNLNLIPTIAIQRTEVVTGGASAAWGSDAVAGVVNLILDAKMNGIKAELQDGISSHGDDFQWKASLAGGTDLGDRGHIFAAFEYAHQDGVGRARGNRDWANTDYSLLANPARLTNGLPANIISPNVYYSTMSAGGLVIGGPLNGTEFLPGGATRQFTFGQIFGDAMIGGQRVDARGGITDLKFPAKRYSGLVHIDLDLTDSVSAFVEASYAHSHTEGTQIFNTDPTSSNRAFTIRADNAFLPASVRTRMATAGVTTITVGRYETDLGPMRTSNTNNVHRLVGGLEGAISDKWTWDGYFQYGRNYLRAQQLNGKRTARGMLAADAVAAPANNALGVAAGTIVCRSSLTNPTNGCTPWNIFGDGSTTQAVKDYVLADGDFRATAQQLVAAANINGSLFSLGAGDISVALGMEYREERLRATTDPVSLASEFAIGNLQPLVGSYNVKEAYFETVVPIFKNQPFAESLEVNGAVRYAVYSNSGGVTTWKGGVTYSPVADIRFRATRSRDIRSPNIDELHRSPTVASGGLIDRYAGVQRVIPNYSAGNPDLRPEIANTVTAGVVLQPSFLEGFRASVDYFSIKISDQIGQVGPQNVIDFCFFSNAPEYCALVTLNATRTQVLNVGNVFVNTSQYKTDGFDFEASYQHRLFDGTLGLRGLATYLRHLTTVLVTPTGTASSDRAGMVAPGAAGALPTMPHWIFNVQATYETERAAFTIGWKHIGASKFDNALIGPDDPGYSPTLVNSINDNTVPGINYVNLSATVNVTDKVQFFGVVNNLLDQAPPPVPSGQYLTNASIYDVLGTEFRVGVRYGF